MEYNPARGNIRLVLALLLGGVGVCGQTLTASQTVGISLLSAGVVFSAPASLSLLSSGTFANYLGSLVVASEVRTSATGNASLTLQGTSEFAPSTGPKIAAGNLSYSCTSANYGTTCSAQTVASMSNQTAVLAFGSQSCTGGGSPCSASDPTLVTLQFQVLDAATYITGVYLATLTFTMSTI